jgi:HK97 gp10 family phage protein
MTFTVQTEGFAELERALAELGDPNTRRDVGRRVLRRVAKPLAEAARTLAPRDRGHMAGSIIVSTRIAGGDAARQAFGRVLRAGGSRAEAVQAMRDIRRASSSLVELYVGPGRHPQAITQEFGTSFHPPQPFMRPAFDSTQGSMIEDIKRELWSDIQRTAARAARRAALTAAARRAALAAADRRAAAEG